MKKELLLLTFLTFTVCASSCISINGGIEPSNNYITRDYKVTDFDKIDISAVANIHYTQSTDNSTSVKVYGPDNIVDLIEVSITDGTLVMKMKKKNISNIKGMKINITSPQIRGITQHGVGNLYAEEGIRTSSLAIYNHGVGNLKIRNIKCEDIDVRATGVGNVELSGEVVNASMSAEGVGNLSADELKSENVEARSNGVGNLSCYATKSISATNSGIGNIRYKGDPVDKKLNKSGIGSIKQI